MQAQAARDSVRAQLQAALQRELDAWPALDRAATCRLGAAGAQCDDDALREPVLARAGVLQSLLEALRQLDPQVDALTIEFRAGRYQAAAQRASAL
jgi:hypothetical protein